MDFEYPDRTKALLEKLHKFMDEVIYPAEPVYEEQMEKAKDRWQLPKGMIDAGEKAAETAVREVLEETGHRGRVLGEKLDDVVYWYVEKRPTGSVRMATGAACGGGVSAGAQAVTTCRPYRHSRAGPSRAVAAGPRGARPCQRTHASTSTDAPGVARC